MKRVAEKERRAKEEKEKELRIARYIGDKRLARALLHNEASRIAYSYAANTCRVVVPAWTRQVCGVLTATRCRCRPGAHRFEAEQKERFAAIERGYARRLADKEAEVAVKDLGETRVGVSLRSYACARATTDATSDATHHVYFATSTHCAE